MTFSATVFNVLIASPSDVPAERQAIANALHEWNALNAQAESIMLQPVMWETHSAPSMGDRPQGIINRQVLRSCDMLIGAFWTRLGSHTGVEESGTVEEIKWFLSENKPVMLYFSKSPIDPDEIDHDQHQRLKAFKVSVRSKGIQEEYRSCEELTAKLSKQITRIIREVTLSPVIDKKGVEAVRASAQEVDTTDAVVAATKRKPKERNEKTADPISLEDYTEKSFIIRGNTIDFKEKLLKKNGKWMKCRDGSFVWMFAKRHFEEVAKILKMPPILGPATC